MTKSGFVSITGRTNVGKSTLLNGLIGEKLAIVTKKPETTRDTIRGILTGEDHQIVFVDTPGVHQPRNLLGKLLLHRAQAEIMDMDIILFVTEPRGFLERDDQNLLKMIKSAPEHNGKVFLVINKIDRVKDKSFVLPMIDEARKAFAFDQIVPLCAFKEKDLGILRSLLVEALPEGEFLYPADQLSDRGGDFMIREIIREKALLFTHQEVPHSVAVSIEEIEENEKGKLLIQAVIYVERPSQKSILIGSEGRMIKRIRTHSEKDIRKALERKVSLDVWVKVRSKWKKDLKALKEFGYSD